MKIKLEEIRADQLGSAAALKVVGSEQGRLLRFTDAVLARAEKNKNQDRFDDQGITEIAATIALTAIDVEHHEQEVIGFFTDGRNVAGALTVDGIVFADRFPKAASDLLSGRAKLSVEANAKSAKCSMCGSEFVGNKVYCDHLTNRRVTGAERILSGLQATGGAVTTHPAGTDTVFNTNRIEFVASFNDEPIEKVEENMPKEDVQASELAETQAQNALLAAQRVFAEYAQQLTNFQPQLNTYRPVMSPLLFAAPNPAWVNELANKVVTALQAQTATTMDAVVAAVTLEDVKKIVDEKIEAMAKKEEKPSEEGVHAGNESVAASTKPAGVGLVGLVWDAPKTQPSLKATW